MLQIEVINSLPNLPGPVLTAYIDTNPASRRNRNKPWAKRSWLKSKSKKLFDSIPKEDQKIFRLQVGRIEKFLSTSPARAKGLVIFSGRGVWDVIRLQVPVEDELHWGKPALKQFLSILDEHQPSGVVVVDRNGVRFFRYWLGEIEEQKNERFLPDRSNWRRKDMVMGKGQQRDLFQQRMDAQYARFFKKITERLLNWAEREKISTVFVAGPDRPVELLWNLLPDEIQNKWALIKGVPLWVSKEELLRRLNPEIEKWKRNRENEEVNAILDAYQPARALGLDETLMRLQEGKARKLLVARGLRGSVSICEKCGWADRSTQDVCGLCGGKIQNSSIRSVLPEVARTMSVPVEIVEGKAASRLKTVGGVAAWLHFS